MSEMKTALNAQSGKNAFWADLIKTSFRKFAESYSNSNMKVGTENRIGTVYNVKSLLTLITLYDAMDSQLWATHVILLESSAKPEPGRDF